MSLQRRILFWTFLDNVKKKCVFRYSSLIPIHHPQAVHERRRIPLSDIKSILSAIDMFMSSKANCIDETILWTCLDDDIDDEALVKDMQSHNPRLSAQEDNSSRFPRISTILRLRRSILQCLLHNVLQMNSKSWSASSMPSESTRPQQYSVSLRGISRLFRMTISLLDIHVISNVSFDLSFGFLVHCDAHSFLWM